MIPRVDRRTTSWHGDDHDVESADIEETDWNIPEVAARLELARSYVYALIRGFGIERETP